MRRLLVIVFLTFYLMAAKAQTYSDAVTGVWISGEGDGKIEVYKTGNKYFGKITWLKEPDDPDTGKPKLDDENPNDDLQNKPVLGLVVLKNFVFADGFWQEGSIYDPANGRTYDCEMWLDGNNYLKIRGYWGFVYRTETWTRSR
ncbi:MAG: DUF2147 domain-containing protein [Chitinophagales bacterium]|nr:DUF2147 domain-containing protein [Chitinophagales bacterium]